MKLLVLLLGAILIAGRVEAGWWIFGDDEDEAPRLSELMEPASRCIDEASDLASEGRVTEAVQKYHDALKELDLLERNHPDRVDRPEFASIKTKRAFVSAAIDSMLLGQARDNAKVVSTSDTTELEKRLRDEKSVKTPRDRAIRAVALKDFAAADSAIGEMLKANPKSAVALNLRAAKEAAEGQFKAAERTLDEAIESNPRDYHAYYNMAVLYLQTRKGDRSAARRYYETGRIFGGPKDDELEDALR